MSYTYPFRMASATATMLVIYPNESVLESQVLFGKRGDLSDVHPGKLSLPGGFMEAKYQCRSWDDLTTIQKLWYGLRMAETWPQAHAGESVETTAIRELKEETCGDFTEDQLNLFHVSSTPGTDPRAHVVNSCFWLEATTDQVNSLCAGDDLGSIEWMTIRDFLANPPKDMAFNHLDLGIRGVNHYMRERRVRELEAKYG